MSVWAFQMQFASRSGSPHDDSVSSSKHNVAVVIKMGVYIHGCLFCVGAYYGM